MKLSHTTSLNPTLNILDSRSELGIDRSTPGNRFGELKRPELQGVKFLLPTPDFQRLKGNLIRLMKIQRMIEFEDTESLTETTTSGS